MLKRFGHRSRNSGRKFKDALCAEALDHVSMGWLCGPIDINASAEAIETSFGPIIIALRFGVEQLDKLRACDDQRRNLVNFCTADYAPITLPTWGHLSQMCLEVRRTNSRWIFMKTDHECAYKQLPLGPRPRQPHGGGP